jgi:ankyrin repeat protein
MSAGTIPCTNEQMTMTSADLHVDTDIFKLCQIGDLANVKVMVEKGTDVNVTDSMGYTPLIRAAKGGNPDVMIFLLENSADPEIAAFGGMRAIHHACNEACNHPQLAEAALVALLKVDCEVSPRTHAPHHLAAGSS